jgi:hypothetical protein
VVSELVTNAVVHARTDLLVTVARRARGLYLAVRDGQPERPRLAPAGIGCPDVHGRGLFIVEHVASAWGTVPTHDGTGKVVWASVQPGPASDGANGAGSR